MHGCEHIHTHTDIHTRIINYSIFYINSFLIVIFLREPTEEQTSECYDPLHWDKIILQKDSYRWQKVYQIGGEFDKLAV